MVLFDENAVSFRKLRQFPVSGFRFGRVIFFIAPVAHKPAHRKIFREVIGCPFDSERFCSETHDLFADAADSETKGKGICELRTVTEMVSLDYPPYIHLSQKCPAVTSPVKVFECIIDCLKGIDAGLGVNFRGNILCT